MPGKPGSIRSGSVGIGSAVHISAEKFRSPPASRRPYVPYRGGAEVITTSLAAGSISISVARDCAAADPRRPVRALVVSTDKRVVVCHTDAAEASLKNARARSGRLCSCPGAIIEKLPAAG